MYLEMKHNNLLTSKLTYKQTMIPESTTKVIRTNVHKSKAQPINYHINNKGIRNIVKQ